MARTINLSEGHDWAEAESLGAQYTDWLCKRCGALFCHDGEDGSTQFESGDGSCDSDPKGVTE